MQDPLTPLELERLETQWMELQSCANCWKHVWEKDLTNEAARNQYLDFAGRAGDVLRKLRGW